MTATLGAPALLPVINRSDPNGKQYVGRADGVPVCVLRDGERRATSLTPVFFD